MALAARRDFHRIIDHLFKGEWGLRSRFGISLYGHPLCFWLRNGKETAAKTKTGYQHFVWISLMGT